MWISTSWLGASTASEPRRTRWILAHESQAPFQVFLLTSHARGGGICPGVSFLSQWTLTCVTILIPNVAGAFAATGDVDDGHLQG